MVTAANVLQKMVSKLPGMGEDKPAGKMPKGQTVRDISHAKPNGAPAHAGDLKLGEAIVGCACIIGMVALSLGILAAGWTLIAYGVMQGNVGMLAAGSTIVTLGFLFGGGCLCRVACCTKNGSSSQTSLSGGY